MKRRNVRLVWWDFFNFQFFKQCGARNKEKKRKGNIIEKEKKKRIEKKRVLKEKETVRQ